MDNLSLKENNLMDTIEASEKEIVYLNECKEEEELDEDDTNELKALKLKINDAKISKKELK